MLAFPALRDARPARAVRRKLRLVHLCVSYVRRADTKERRARRAASRAVLDPLAPMDRRAVHRAKRARTRPATRRSAWIASRASTADLEHLPAQNARQASMLTPPAPRDARRARAARRKLRLDHLRVNCARRADTKEQLGRRAAMLAVLDPSAPTDRPAVHRAKGANTPRATRRSAWIA